MNWKKRGQAGWNGRKTAKKLPGIERQYGKTEARQQLQEHFEGDDYRHKGGIRSRSRKGQLQYRVDYYERCLKNEVLKEEKARANGDVYWRSNWCDSSYYRSSIKKMKEEIKEIDTKK
jgi:hypothetical protein